MVAIKDLFDAILKRAEEAIAHGVRPRLDETKTEYFITIPQGYKTRPYKVLIISGSEGIKIQTYDRGKLQYDEKLPDATLEEALKRLPLDFIRISRKDVPEPRTFPRRRPDR